MFLIPSHDRTYPCSRPVAVSCLSKLSNTFSVVNHYLYAQIPMLGNVPYPPVPHPSMIHPRMYVS